MVSALAGVGQLDQLSNELPPEQVREAVLEGLASQLLTFGAGKAACIVIEDLHWFDPSSREVLDRIIDDLPNRRTLMLITCRSDSPAKFPAKVHATMRLGRLAPDDVAALIQGLAGAQVVDRLAAGILERTDGVPLFVEELTRALMQETGVSTISPASIPASLEESLVARLDRSGPGKEVAQAASVIGRSVRRDVLEQVSGVDSSRLTEALQNLVRIGVFERLRGAPTESYTFHHALLRDAAYASLVRERRRDLHSRVAHALQALDAASLELYPEMLAQHLSEAGRPEEAAVHWITAARRSLTRSALQEAASIYRAR
jgi:predicted ATPase